MTATLLHRLGRPHLAAAIVLVAAGGTVGAALVMEHAFGYRPCQLCLWQRNPYYLALPLALLGALAPARAVWLRPLLGLIALVFLVSAGLGAYHAGVEWGVFAGPSDCGGGAGSAPAGMGDFLKQLDTVRVVSCTDAAWRFLGLSLAGWNAVVSLALTAVAGAAAWRRGLSST